MKILFFYILLALTISQVNAISELEKIASKQEGTKWEHDYLAIYDQYFAPIRDKKITLLEIGFGSGPSAHMWEEYFPAAELHYIDILPLNIKDFHLSDRSHLHIGHQADELLLYFLTNSIDGFDIIIDDGSHVTEEQIFTLEYLFPHVKSGGVYVIEDLHTSYWKDFGGEGMPGEPKASPRSTTEYLKELVDRVNYVGAFTGCANRTMAKNRVDTGVDKHGTYSFPKDFFETLDDWARDIKSIHFYDSICFIFKR